ncbi:MAG TPA: type II toxin-antitoxin system prevent-host-death family antitoxin [Casimicrobiaceae bacterium]|nr:type II toxin-antitoxin system prevent-host-death family antitoxin [Casimicrobiaceae bacterium]
MSCSTEVSQRNDSRQTRQRRRRPVYFRYNHAFGRAGIKDNLSWFLREAEGEEIIITRNGKPVGVLIGLASDDDWLDYQLEYDPRFVRRIEQARTSLREGGGIKIEDVE